MHSPVRRTIATVCLSGMLDDKLQAAAAAGFDGIELFETDLVNSQLSPEQIRRRVRRTARPHRHRPRPRDAGGRRRLTCTCDQDHHLGGTVQRQRR